MVLVITKERRAEAQPIIDRINEILRRMLEIYEHVSVSGTYEVGMPQEADRLSHEHADLKAKLEALAIEQ